MTLKTVIEALVFASPKPLLTKEIVAALKAAGEGTENENALEFAKAKEADVLAALEELQVELSTTGRAFQVIERVNGWTLVSDASCAAWVRQLYPEAKPTRLSGPQLETLAIVAYRQPVTRADIEAVRGVAVDGVMQVLLDRGLVKIAGRAEVPGRPLLYSTTAYFLEHFGLKTTDDLPNAGELKRVVLPTAPVPEDPKAKEAKTAKEGEAQPEAAAAETPAEGAAEATAEAAPESTESATAPAEEAETVATEEVVAEDAAPEESVPLSETPVEVESSEPESAAETNVVEPEPPAEPPPANE
jgi:segregation and condensation protein B